MAIGVGVRSGGMPDRELSDALLVQVEERIGQATTFRLVYDVDIDEGDLPLLADDRLSPGSELSIVVPVGTANECLVTGPVCGHRIHLTHGGEGSRLAVHGADSSITMDRETQAAIWSDVTDSDVVQSILSQYSYMNDVDPTSAQHPETKHTMVQRESDLRFVRRLARRNGNLFWITADATTGMETAHFKRPPTGDASAGDLVINLDSPALSDLEISFDVERPTSVEAFQLDLNAKSVIDGSVSRSPLAPLGSQSLATITGDTRSAHLAAPVDESGDLQARGEGLLIDADWFVHGRCQTMLETLGRLVRSHTVVSIRGAGRRHSGKYLVAGVCHTIDAGGHHMDIDLLRDSWNE